MQDKEGKITNELTPQDLQEQYQDFRFTKNEKPKSITEYIKEIHATNKEKGFWDKPRNTGEMLMLVTSELAEGLEADRKDRYCKLENLSFANPKTEAGKEMFELHIKDTLEDELADAVIRLFDMAGGLEIDLEKHIALKLEYNKTRARMHGKKY